MFVFPESQQSDSNTSKHYDFKLLSLFRPGIQVLAAPSWLLFEPYEFVTDT